MDTRGANARRLRPGRFRCLPCQEYVTGTDTGHCPRCGFVPPQMLELPREATSYRWWLISAIALAALIACVAILR